jgi:cytolysin (calcineurin-like family phosphatase)
MTIANLIAAALKDTTTEGITIYWDSQDSENEGPAWRTETESGALEFRGWTAEDKRNATPDVVEGYNVSDYFRSGRYLGPDQYGVYPILIDA